MEYHTVFEIDRNGLGVLWFPLLGFIPFIIGILLIKFRDRVGRKGSENFARSFGIVFSSFSMIWVLLGSASLGIIQSDLRNKYKKGMFNIVEGSINNFDPDPRGDREMEKFTVNGKTFEYNYFEITPGFTHTSYHGGPIKEGLRVRISYIDDVIVRLEVKS